MAKTKESKEKRASISITFTYNKEDGYYWHVNDPDAQGVIGGGYFKSHLGIILDYDFIKALMKYLGKNSVDKAILKIAKDGYEEEKRNRIPFSDEMIDRLEAKLGTKIRRSRTKTVKE